MFVTATARGFRIVGANVARVIAAVSITPTVPSANSVTKSFRPCGESARPTGSEPTATGALTTGDAPLIPVIFTTVASARFAT